MPESVSDPELLGAEWDLSELVGGDTENGAERLLDEAVARATALADAYRGRVASLSAAELTTLLREVESITDLKQRATCFAELWFATDTADPDRGVLEQAARERANEIESTLLFLDLEWLAVPDEAAENVLTDAGDDLRFASHYLRSLRAKRPYMLSEAEERVLADRRLTGEQAWVRLFTELISAMTVELDGDEVPFDVAYNQLSDPVRERRREAAEAMSVAMAPGVRTRGYIFNTLLSERAGEDRLRGRPHWLTARNLENDASDESVMALINAVRDRFDIAHRFNRVKAQVIGVERLAEYDRSAPVLADESPVRYGEARDLVLSAYDDLSAEAGSIARRFFDERWIDAPIRPHKMGGAFCEDLATSVNPYVLVNFGGRRQDVLTLAHELGHGLHGVLAQRQGALQQQKAATVAETASTFGEHLVRERLLAAAQSDRERLGLLFESVGRSVLTVFLQIAFNRFEHLCQRARSRTGELSVTQIDQLWLEALGEVDGGTIQPLEGYEHFWSVVPHFVMLPGYVYAYAYGQLLSLSLFARYKELGHGFVPKYLEMLAAGGSQSPEDLGRIVGVDLSDPGFWRSGLDLIEEELTTVERMAGELERV